MSILEEIKNNPITDIVSKEAIEQLDDLIEKLKIACAYQEKLNRAIKEGRDLA